MERLGIIGHSRAMLDLFCTLKHVAPHQSTVLVLGESGTGKELIARALHALGQRFKGAFIPINCATLSENLLESEIFGHDRGAFTGANQSKQGMMELAHNGTLFLDEVNEMGPSCQAKLLRVLERREFRRVGGTRKLHVDVNLIAASNCSLEDCVATGKFRDDLYYRIKVVTLVVPPLRDRRDAIPVLARRFLEEISARIGFSPKRLAPGTLDALVRYDWPGNIRELRNLMESLMLMVRREIVLPGDLPLNICSPPVQEVLIRVGTSLWEAEREIIRATLAASPTIKAAAAILGLGLRTLHTKLRVYGLRHTRTPQERRR